MGQGTGNIEAKAILRVVLDELVTSWKLIFTHSYLTTNFVPYPHIPSITPFPHHLTHCIQNSNPHPRQLVEYQPAFTYHNHHNHALPHSPPSSSSASPSSPLRKRATIVNCNDPRTGLSPHVGSPSTRTGYITNTGAQIEE
ncbi:hypothetical protein HO173_010353 [Letharia columbiana]|uniref:Uncharacterized protein n=1 Tax=Letharia columbiana TaxID=112416 RepID=A0A8H6L0Y2_9LECA|nr:uncharacterized protein HO173_010353 [Letharia columbiana]KAF6231393.1 hypothetical protein HO173_010353 [Letharia columbiana]